jgi:hypothetical protein
MKRGIGILIGVGSFLAFALHTVPSSAGEVCSHPIEFRPLPSVIDSGESGGIGGSGAPAVAAADQAGESAQPVRKGGIGGTGHGADEAAGGIGGTGIVGTVTGFASVCVNGLEVHYDAGVAVSENGRPASADRLAVGQLVSIEAQQSARGLEARHIHVVHALEGPITRAAGADGSVEVMGAQVLATGVESRAAGAGLQVGEWVQVSGHYGEAGRIHASRITRVEARPEATVVGPVGATGVGGVVVDRAGVSAPAGDVLVRGHWDGHRLAVRETRPSPAGDWTQRPERLVMETRLRERAGDRIRTGIVEVDPVLQGRTGDMRSGELMRVTVRVDAQGGLHPERVEGGREARPSRLDGQGGDDGQQDDRRRRSGKVEDEAERSVEKDAKAAENAAKAGEKADKTGEKGGQKTEAATKAEKADKIAKPDKAEKPSGNRNGGDRPDRWRPDRSERSGRDR